MDGSFKSGTRSTEARARAKRAASASMRGGLALNLLTFVNDGTTTYIRRKTNDSDAGAGTTQSDKSAYNMPGSGNGQSFTNGVRFPGIYISHSNAGTGTFPPAQFTYTTSGNGTFCNGLNFSGINISHTGTGTSNFPPAQCVNTNAPGLGNIFNNGVNYGRNFTVVNSTGSCSISQTRSKTVIYCDGDDAAIYSTGTGNVTVMNVGAKRPSTNQARSGTSAKRTRVDTNGNYWQSDSSDDYSDDWLSMFNTS